MPSYLKFGFGDNYYELRQPVYTGWDEGKNRNSVDLDLKWLTALKLKDSTSVRKFRETDIFADSINFKFLRCGLFWNFSKTHIDF